jgi:hypothetical protein
MATSVTSAFNELLKDKVNLDSQKTKDARGSKDWLIEQIHKLPENDTEFPKLYEDIDIQFGSFARRTKIRPLDDIDLMIGIWANGTTYLDWSGKIELTVPEYATNLLKLCNDYSNKLNSIKVINKFIKSLKGISQYAKSDISRNQEAAVLDLSYEWNFDIVPCFLTKADYYGRTYYIIPDGMGNWKKTDPRIDKERVTTINQNHNGNVLNIIRILKYWNKRPTMPSAPSYMFENLILNYFASVPNNDVSTYIDVSLPYLLSYIQTNIYYAVNDPKGIQGDLNTLSYADKQIISNRAGADFIKAREARQLETDGKYKESINKWREIFGEDFPKYE